MQYKAVIFDLDGTLLNTIIDISESFNTCLTKHNYKTYNEDDYKIFVGKGVDVLVNKIIAASNLPVSKFDILKKEYLDIYEKNQFNKTKPYDGIIELLKELNKNNVIVNILSNKPHSQVVQIVNHYFKGIEFGEVYGKKLEFPIKPDPKSVNDIIKKLEINKKEILYVGDTSTDMETAHNAGLKSVGVLWGFRKEKELVESRASYIVKNPEQILKIVMGEGNDFK